MTYYQKHIFICCNQRSDGRKACGQSNADVLRDYAKTRLKNLELHGAGKIRISTSGCLGRCALGPVLVIYPDAVWYTYNNYDDIDEIIESYLLRGKLVPRLLLGD